MLILSRIFLHILTFLSINAYFAYLHAYFDIVRIFTRIFRHFLKLSNIKIKKNRKKSQLRAGLISGVYMG